MLKHINPYIEHGQKSKSVKKMTISVPEKIYDTVKAERKRRIDNKMRHATTSELFCEAFAHAFTGQPLPTDEELLRYVSKSRLEKYELMKKKTKDENINNAMSIAENYVGYPEFREVMLNIINSSISSNEKTIQLYRIINLLVTFVLSDTMNSFALRNEASKLYQVVEKANKFNHFKDFVEYNVNSPNRNTLIANEIHKLLNNK